MKLKIDENMSAEVAAMLQAAGHDVETVVSEGLIGCPDPHIAEVCRAEERALVTLDTDFGNVLAYPPADHRGLIVLRPRGQDRPTVVRLTTRLIALLDTEPVDRRLWIVEEQRLRIRE